MLKNKIFNSVIDERYKKIIEVLESSDRPKPIRKYDQIYMLSEDLINQALFYSDYFENKAIAFLGDGDAMGITLALMTKFNIIKSIKRITIFDFDERILNYYKKVAKDENLDEYLDFEICHYNIIDPIPYVFRDKFDVFYMNPPYGSKSHGRSCEAWVYRCIDVVKEGSLGFIIVPYDSKEIWTLNNMHNIQKFLLEKDFTIRGMIEDLHLYHLEDNPNLLSATLIVDLFCKMESEYLEVCLPNEYKKNLYGDTRRIPHYIYDDGSEYGRESDDEC